MISLASRFSVFMFAIVLLGSDALGQGLSSESVGVEGRMPAGLTFISGDDIPLDRAVYSALRRIDRREDGARGSGASFLVEDVGMSQDAANLVLELSGEIEREMQELNLTMARDMCSRRDTLTASPQLFVEFFVESEAKNEQVRKSAYIRLETLLDSEELEKIAKYARRLANQISISVADHEGMLQSQSMIDREAIAMELSKTCGQL